jgi:hypothetical protein
MVIPDLIWSETILDYLICCEHMYIFINYFKKEVKMKKENMF